MKFNPNNTLKYLKMYEYLIMYWFGNEFNINGDEEIYSIGNPKRNI